MTKKDLTIVFDFDGTLNVYTDWRGHGNIGEEKFDENGEPYVDLVKWFFERGWTCKLATTRLNPYPFGEGLMDEPDEAVVSGEAKEHIMDWLKKHKILKCFKEISGRKVYGDGYIDDRNIKGLETIDEIKEWAIDKEKENASSTPK